MCWSSQFPGDPMSKTGLFVYFGQAANPGEEFKVKKIRKKKVIKRTVNFFTYLNFKISDNFIKCQENSLQMLL